MVTLFFDTETTGKWDFKAKKKYKDDNQPKLVQIAAILLDDNLVELSSVNLIVHPTKWIIPEEAANIHGISQEKALKFGVSLSTVIDTFLQMVEVSDKVVAHNSEYDVNIIRHACHTLGEEDSDPFAGKQVWCTMKAAVPVVKVLHANPRHDKDYKYPKLEECVRYFFDREISGAHDALVDVRECIAVYKALCEHYGMEP